MAKMHSPRSANFRWVKPGACGHLGGPRQGLGVDILTDVCHFAISNGNGEDPMVLERLIRGYDSPPRESVLNKRRRFRLRVWWSRDWLASHGTTPGLDLRHASSDGEFYAGNV